MTMEKQLLTITAFEDFLAANPDRLYELINGEIVEKVVTQEHAKIAGILIGELYIYLKMHPEVKAHMGPEARFSPVDDDGNDRKPDVSVHLTDAPPVKKGAVEGMPDLAVEIKSPTNTYLELREKARFYLDNGCKLVWLVYPEKGIIDVYQPKQDIQILTSEDTLDGSTILPGFSIPVKTIVGS